MNFILIGYMGVGKSTVGRLLANSLEMSFVDLDEYLINKEQKSISEIFEIQGEYTFRNLELKYVREIFETHENIVLATGGGTPTINGVWDLFNEYGKTFYLSLPPEKIIKNLNPEAVKQRPLLSEVASEAFSAYVIEHLRMRVPHYKKADYIIDTSGKSPYEITADIIAVIEKEKLLPL